MTALNTVFTISSGFGVVISLIPLWWHLQSWNVGTCMFMIWTALACLSCFVNTILWSGNTVNWAPVWCDIALRIQIGAGVGLPACSLCVVRRLRRITCTVQTVEAEKLRGVIVDLFITLGIPLLQMAIEYTIASHRFAIIEDFGCYPAARNTPLAYILVWSWPLIIGVVSSYYGALTIRAFMERRKQSKNFIGTNACLSYDRYWRLIALASADFCFTIPLAIRSIVTNSLSGVSPWVSWADTHAEYSRIPQVPRIVVDQDQNAISSYEINRWTPVLCALFFFGFFGFTNEARKNYRLLAATIAKLLGFTFVKNASTPGSYAIDHSLHFALPMSTTQQTVSGRDSDSFSDKLSIAVQYHSPTNRPTSTGSTTLSIDEVPRVPEPILDPVLVRKSSAPDTPTFFHQDNSADRLWIPSHGPPC